MGPRKCETLYTDQKKKKKKHNLLSQVCINYSLCSNSTNLKAIQVTETNVFIVFPMFECLSFTVVQNPWLQPPPPPPLEQTCKSYVKAMMYSETWELGISKVLRTKVS